MFSTDGVVLDDLKKIDRIREPPDSGLMCELLWADPQEQVISTNHDVTFFLQLIIDDITQNGRAPSKRGVGLSFGPDVTQRFLATNNLELVIRSHECKDNGASFLPYHGHPLLIIQQVIRLIMVASALLCSLPPTIVTRSVTKGPLLYSRMTSSPTS